MLLRAAVLVVALALGACATVDATSTESQSKARDARMARLYFIWPKSYMLKTGTLDIKIDGQVVGKIAPASYFFVDRPPGAYTLKVEPPLDFAYFETEVRVATGSTHYYAIHVKPAYIPVGYSAMQMRHPNLGTALPQKGGGHNFATYSLGVIDSLGGADAIAQLGGR